MHPAARFRDDDPTHLAALVRASGLAVIFAVTDRQPVCAHAPILLEGARSRFHLSAGNPLAGALSGGAPALAVVTGPHAYVSPDWYGLDDQVPTWNYLSVEIAGPVRRLDADEATCLLDDLSAAFEGPLAPKPPWTRHKMSPGRFEALLAGIVGFEMQVERLEGVRKLSQNKPPAAQALVAKALAEHGDHEIARLMGDAAARS